MMTTVEDISKYLDLCTNAPQYGCVAGTGLTAIYKQVFETTKAPPKAQMIQSLAPFYAQRSNVEAIWQGLSDCERAFITYIVQYEGKEYLSTTIDIAQKYHLALEYEDRWGGIQNIVDGFKDHHCRVLFLLKRHFPKTKTVLFFPNGKTMAFFALATLKEIVGPLKIVFSTYQPLQKAYAICREHQQADFTAVVRFAAREKIKVKAGTYDITKAKLAKMVQSIGFEEVCDNGGLFGMPTDTKRLCDFKVGLPLFLLSINGGLLNIEGDGTIVPSKQSAQLLTFNPHRLAKKLFDDYMAPNKIYELHYIPYLTLYDGNSSVPWHICRKTIVDALKIVPVNQWVSYKDFDQYLRIFHTHFFQKFLNCALTVKGFDFDFYYYHRYEPDWDECEAQIIRLVLSFLSALGMLDVSYIEKTPRIRFGNRDFCVGIGGFRITPLGAWVLGLTDDYVEETPTPTENEAGRLMVLPDYTILISGLKCRIQHETYLSRFLTKVADDTHVSTYKLDFASALRAYGIGLTPNHIKEYLEKASEIPLPDNVLRTLSDWQGKCQRVHIKTVTVIETDDPLLLAEIKHLRSMDQMISEDIQHAVVLDSNQQKKAKTIIEKNGWFVTWDKK